MQHTIVGWIKSFSPLAHPSTLIGNELKQISLPGTRTISGSSNASAKELAVASQEVNGEDKGEGGVNETTEAPITTQAIIFYSTCMVIGHKHM